MKSINSRKGQTSITHLMNFSLPPRPYTQHQSYNPYSQRSSRQNPSWGIGSGYHAIDKARYIHANYRFINDPDREYHAQAVDADVHLDWDAVLQILASRESQSTSCPICLSDPVASRMAKCGHIFCLPCLIRYMHSTKDATHGPTEKRARWKKCPICEDIIYVSDTRPVRWFEGKDASMLRVGGDIFLKLLSRVPGSTLALPRDAIESPAHQQDIPWYHVAEVLDHARFMKGGQTYMINQYDQEIDQLRQLEKEDELIFGEDATWTQKAISSIRDAEQKLSNMSDPPRLSEPCDSHHTGPAEATTALASLELHDTSSTVSRTEVHHSPNASVHRHTHNNGYFFYHTLPNSFLSSLDVRILKEAFGAYSSFPSTLLPRIEHISTGHMVDDELRKRMKYLSHLPYGCEVNFVECDWTDIIGPDVLARFGAEIERRRKKNHEKATREEKAKIRAEMKEYDPKWAPIGERRSATTVAGFRGGDSPWQSQTEGNSQTIGSPPLHADDLSNSPPWPAVRTHSSFAALASPGSSPEAPRTVWGTAAVPPTSPPLEPLSQRDQKVDDGWLQDWERDLFDDDNVVALVNARANATEMPPTTSKLGGGKKKKSKKITLMSTNARRRA